ncbi:MAG: M16 family metallopeptidase [Fidelibacterota bacterium]
MKFLAQGITEKEVIPGVRVVTKKTDIVDVVSIQGSLLGGDVFSPESNSVVADVTAAMLDEGTLYRDKFAISVALENVGAHLSFRCSKYRVRFWARCLTKDVPLVVELLAEQLRFPLIKPDDLAVTKKRRVGELKKSREDTRARAMEVFLQKIYPPDHPNYSVPLSRQIRHTEGVTARLVKDFHERNYGRGNLIIVAVGAVDHSALEGAVAKGFDGWQRSRLSLDLAAGRRARRRRKPFRQVVTLKDKTSVDLVVGRGIGIDRKHEDFDPLMVALYVLGGNFSARLMTSVRDKEGLTYGVSSSVGGVENGNDGYWSIWGTFAPHLLQRGYASVMKQLDGWVKDGVTPEELETKKTTITGVYAVSLASTGGLAGRTLSLLEQGRDLSYLDEYPERIRELSLEKVNHTIETYCPGDKLVAVAAGALDKGWHPLDSSGQD